MSHPRFLAALASALVVLGAIPASADCTDFKWPLEAELAWLAAGDNVAVKSGGELAEVPAKAVALALQPAKSVTMPVASGVKEQAVGADTFSGWFTLPAGLTPGRYQISLSTNGWVDVVQGGALVRSKGFSGSHDCKTIRKSVRFEIGPGPVTIQITGVKADAVRLTLSAAK